MKQPILLALGLKELHWADLTKVHLELGYCRQQFIQTVNEKLAAQPEVNLDHLDQLARIDELLKTAGDTLENAKTILFNLCYDGEGVASKDGDDQ